MEGYAFRPEEGIGFKAMLTGATLIAAQKTDRIIPVLGKDKTTEVNLTWTLWLKAEQNAEAAKGIAVSIQEMKFEADAIYYVYYVPDARPPCLFAIRIPG